MGDPRVVRFIQLLVSRGFVEDMPVTVNGSQKKLFRFGPLGTLLRRNILKQWWDAVVMNQPKAFCVENPPVTTDLQMPGCLELQSVSSRLSSLSNDYSSTYMPAVKLMNGQLPVTVATCGQCISQTSESVDCNTQKLLANGLWKMHLQVQHYSPPVGVSQVFDYWLRSRLRWWRQFSSNPSKFNTVAVTASDAQKTDDKNGRVANAITYAFPWGTETIETVCNLGDGPLKQSEKTTGISHQARFHQKMFYPHLIECHTSLEQCMTVFLTDAYRERDEKKKSPSASQDGNRFLMLHLHPVLSPYQVALSVSGSRAQEVRVLAEHVAGELREMGISVLQAPASQNSMESQYRRNDELGIPYTVVMSDQTIDSGIIMIYSRDTRLKQQHHISHLQSILSRNIGIEKSR